MVHVRNSFLSVDPYMRGRMNDVKSYVPPFQIGEPLEGGAIGEVVESSSPDFQPGDTVLHMSGWRDEAIVPAAALNKLPAIPGVEPQAFLGNLGLTGGTAYWGLIDAAQAREGDIVFVSAAAGAVGSAVVQIAKAKGMTVIGSAGGADKVEFVKSLGADVVIDYKSGTPLVKALSEVAPQGHRRLFRQCRRRASGRRACACPQGRPLRPSAHDRGLQQRRPRPSWRYIMRVIAMRIPLAGASSTPTTCPAIREFYAEMDQGCGPGQIKAVTRCRGIGEDAGSVFLGWFTGANTRQDAGEDLRAFRRSPSGSWSRSD
jgi:hypothetical protein